MQLSTGRTTKSEQFFDAIFGKETINFNCIHYKTGVPSPPINGLYNANTINVLEQFNRQNYEIYFVVNGGGYKNRDINKINAVFIDLDCPKVNGQQPSLNDVKEFKQQSIDAIQEFHIKPTIIVESRNGYHAYWLLHEGATIEQFKECEARLVKQFNADPKVQKPCNLMRVPGFYWCKDVDNKFLVEIVEFNNYRYKIEDILNALLEVEMADRGFCTNNNHKYSRTLVVIDGTNNPSHSNENIEFIKTRNIQALQQLLNPQPIILSNNEVWDYLKKQPLHQFLGVNKNKFYCLIHKDNNPSAGIIVNEDSGHHIYCCASSNCGFKGTIIDVTEQLTGLNQYDTLNFLRKVYRIEFAETEWGQNQRELLERNQQLIYDQTIPALYPEVHKLVKSYLPLLETLHQIAKQHIYTETFSDSSGRPVFFVSIRELARKLKKDSKNVSIHLAVLTYLGLVKKLSKEEIPEPFLKRANEEAIRHIHKYVIGFYSVPSYDSQSLAFSTTKAIEFKEKGFTIRGFSREMLLLSLGEAEANRVFPQMAGQAIPQLNEEITSKMEIVALQLIRQKGWTTEKEILEQVKLRFKGQQRFKETQIKRILPDMCDKYLLIRVPLNNELKQRFGIYCTGFPRIIIEDEAA